MTERCNNIVREKSFIWLKSSEQFLPSMAPNTSLLFLFFLRLYFIEKSDLQREEVEIKGLCLLIHYPSLSQSEARNQEILPDLPCGCSVQRLWAILDCFPRPQIGSWMGSGAADGHDLVSILDARKCHVLGSMQWLCWHKGMKRTALPFGNTQRSFQLFGKAQRVSFHPSWHSLIIFCMDTQPPHKEFCDLLRHCSLLLWGGLCNGCELGS